MSSPDTIVLITTSYPRWDNGREAAGSFVADLAEMLSHRVNVRVVAPGDRQEIQVKSDSLSVYRYAAPERRLVNLRIWNPIEALKILATLSAGAAATRDAANDRRVFHVLALWALPSGNWANRIWREKGIPYSVWMLGSDVWLLGKIPVVRSVLRRVMRDATVRFADGLQLAQDSQQICGRDVAFLPSTRQLQTSTPAALAAQPPYRLVFIGRWHSHKGVDLLLDALGMLRDEDWERIEEVHLYGGGPLAALVEQKAGALIAVGRPIKVGGFIPKDEAERAITRADYLIIPSRIESIPVIFSDAVKLGRPVISTPVGDLPLLFEQAQCGVMAPEISAVGICQALQVALSTPPVTFAAAVHHQADKFDLSAIAGEVLGAAAAGRRAGQVPVN